MNPSNFSQVGYVAMWLTIYGIILIAFLGGIIAFIISGYRKRNEKLRQYNVTFLHIKLPPQNEIEIKAAEQFFGGLMSIKKSWWQALWTGRNRVSFEIVSKAEGIGFYVVVPDELALLVEKQINGAYPQAEIDIINPNEIWDRGKYTAIAEFKLSGAPYYPIKVYEDLQADPLSALTSTLGKLGDNEVVAIQFVIQPADNSWRRYGSKFVSDVKAKGSDPEKKVAIDTSFLEGVEKKIAKPGFNVRVRVVSISETYMQAASHIDNVASAFEQFTEVKYNSFKKTKPLSSKKFIHDFIYRKVANKEIYIPIFEIPLYRNTSVLNIEEMATVFHFPNKEIQTPNIIWLTARKSSAPTDLPTAGLYLGKNEYRGVSKKIFMLEKDRSRHQYIIGQTGTGKSEFMKSLAVQDIYNGEGLAFIDPHGSDIDDLLEKIPESRMEDVILFDASDNRRPLGLNILEAKSEEQKHMIINAFIALLYKLYDPNRTGIMGPKLERAIRNVMLTAMAIEGSTLVDVLRLLIDQKYVQTYLPKVTDPLVKRYWTDEVAQTSDFHKSETMGYFVSKFDRFVTDATMRRILGQPKTAFDFGDIMATRKILLVDLSKGKIGEENSNFLGLVLVPKILAAALSRATLLGKEEFPNFYLYVDEFQNFATPDFATILSEARKYKLNLIVAHQFIEQLSEDIRDAVFGNVGTITTFRVGADDAEYLEHQFEPTFTESDLINLSVGNCYARLLVNGQPSAPFSLRVDWESINATAKNPDVAARIRELSRTKYGTSVEEVEEYINKRAGFDEVPQPVSFPKKPLPF